MVGSEVFLREVWISNPPSRCGHVMMSHCLIQTRTQTFLTICSSLLWCFLLFCHCLPLVWQHSLPVSPLALAHLIPGFKFVHTRFVLLLTSLLVVTCVDQNALGSWDLCFLCNSNLSLFLNEMSCYCCCRCCCCWTLRLQLRSRRLPAGALGIASTTWKMKSRQQNLCD